MKPAFGFHPEQQLPNDNELSNLFNWMEQHRDKMIAIGEVGLPYYLRKDSKINRKQYNQYIEMLEMFINLAKKWNKPIVLHAVYEDAPIVCELLEKYSVKNAHFHWFKGDGKTTKRMMENGYFISITPDVVYKEKIQQLVQAYPLDKIMVETDGPWPFEGPFTGKMTIPTMMKDSISIIAQLKKLEKVETEEIIYKNTKGFYKI